MRIDSFSHWQCVFNLIVTFRAQSDRGSSETRGALLVWSTLSAQGNVAVDDEGGRPDNSLRPYSLICFCLPYLFFLFPTVAR